MARTLQQILDQMDAEQAAQSGLSGLNSPSQTSIYKLWKYVPAMLIYLHELLIDDKVEEVETALTNGAIPSDSWLQQKVLEFQYSATVPQVITLVDGVPKYAVVDESLRIITRASVKTSTNNTVTVKVAKSDPPVALSAGELSSLQGYLTQGGNGTIAGAGIGIGFAGVRIVASSTTSDKLFIKGTVYYNGQYASVIEANVIAALENYMATLPFDGSISVLGITDAIQAVTGVTDIFIEEIAIRANSTAFASRTKLINSFTQVLTSYPTFAGYIVEETESGETFSDRLTFTAST